MPQATGLHPPRATPRGLRLTLSRELLLGFFRRARTRHWSAEDIYKALLADGETLGISAIRRVLAELEQAGLVARSQFDHSRSVFELADGPPHDHIVCLHCGTVEDFCDPEIAVRRAEVAARHGFELRHHALVLHGHCERPQCQAALRQGG